MFSSNTSQVSDDKLFVEDCFSCFVYTGNGGTQTITNGIDLAGKGGLVWIKGRNVSPNQSHFLFDTSRGSDYRLSTDTTNAQDNSFGSQYLTGFNSNGFSLDGRIGVNGSTYTYASWTFRKAPKFFDVVTYTGNGSTSRQISHSLGVTPGTVIVKKTSSGGTSWLVWHRALSATQSLALQATDAVISGGDWWGGQLPTATTFSVGDTLRTNENGSTFVAYLFAHDTTSDGIIQCGSYVRTGSSVSVNLGWEPQWVLVKKATDINGFGGSNWAIADNMRGFDVTSWSRLNPNTTNAETTGVTGLSPDATGFTVTNASGQADSGETYIYIAIRRGPMRTPTSGTSVFGVNTATQAINSSTRPPAVSFITDMAMYRARSSAFDWVDVDRLRGSNWLVTNSTGAEASGINAKFDTMTGWYPDVSPWEPSASYLFYNFRRAPSFFDEVCYTGTGSARTVNHNLSVAPELIILKQRSGSSIGNWMVYSAATGNSNALILNSTAAVTATSYWNNTSPTASVFSLSGAAQDNNANGSPYVAYLFASCPGVSKVGSYTGNGSSQTINCGFAAGARFVMIKRTDSTGNWLVADSARGIVAGNDPLLYLNSTAAEVTTLDWIDADASGFIVNQDATANANVNGATYIYLAIS